MKNKQKKTQNFNTIRRQTELVRINAMNAYTDVLNNLDHLTMGGFQ